jgi:ABC-2 type transport system permease protein
MSAPNSLPIADLSYRGYDGPLDSPTMRWWVIAKAIMRDAVKKRWAWVIMVLSGGYYLLMMATLTILQQQSAALPPPTPGRPNIDPFKQFVDRLNWREEFLHGLSMGQMWFLIITLMIGAGVIANDNRANALLVYLSKPCTKGDYLLGKWMGVFLMISGMMAIPTLVFYLYGMLSLRDYGFLASDPWLGPKLLLIIPLQAALYTSLAIGISSLFNQGRLAGATLAAVYFLSNFFTVMMGGVYAMSREQNSNALPLIKSMFYMSLDGLNNGIAKVILGTDGGQPFGAPGGRNIVPSPGPWVFFALIGLSALFMFFAWKRVRAVEVVG